MRLSEIRVRRVPGIDDPFNVKFPADAGLVLIHGPNASGKSSICRAVRATLWPNAAGAKVRGREWLDRCDVVTTWVDRGAQVEAELLHGSVRWRTDAGDAGAPSLPPSELSHCWSIEIADLLKTSDDTADEFARRIRVAMAGGFDLARVETPDPARLVKERAKLLRAAIVAHHKCRAKHEAFAGDEQDLVGLQAKLDAARRARADQKAVDDAIELAARRAALASLDAALAEFPRELSNLNGDEVERIEALLEDRTKKERARVEQERIADNAKRDLAAAGFGESPPGAEAILACRERLLASEKLYGRAREVEREKLAAQTRLAQASRVLVDVVDGEVLEAVTDADLAGVDEWLGRRGELVAEIRAQRQFVARLSREREREPLPDADAKTLERRAERLSAWLKHTMASASDRWMSARWIVLVVAIVAVAAALVWPWPGIVVGLLALALLAVLLPRRRAVGSDSRGAIEHELSGLGLGADPPWSDMRAATELDKAEAGLAATQRIATFREEEERAAAASTDLSQQLAELEKRRSGLAQRLRVDPESGDVRLRDVVERIAGWRRAQGDFDGAMANSGAAEQQLATELARLGALLERLGGTRPTDVPQAKAAVQALVDRAQAAEKAHRALETATAAIAECQQDASSLGEKASKLLERAGVSGIPGDETRALLRDRVKLLSGFRKQSDQAKGLCLQIEDARRRLKQVGRSDLEAKSAEELERAKQQADLTAGGFEELVGNQKELEFRLGAARQGSELEDARAGERKARAALEETHEEALDAAARRFLLDRLRSRHEQQAQPAMLERAKNLFVAFTRGEWELVVAGEGEKATFRARPNGKPARDLDQLSDGTRAQLLIAARVAFAIENEGGAKLPLFLDEALAVTSPDRFRGVVEAVLALVRDGRQVIYLAADPQDVAHWTNLCANLLAAPPHVIDLAEVRAIAGAASAASLAVAPRRVVPAPDGRDAAAYGEILRVPVFDLFAPIEQAHLFHALRDELSLLHRLLDAGGIESIGACEKIAGLAGTNGDGGLVTSEERERIAARIACTKAWHEAFRVGRGERVDRAALEESLSVSPRYLGPLVEIVREFDGDGRRLLDALANPASDPRTSGFRADKREQLEAFLLDRRHLDPRQRLTPVEIRARVLAAAQLWIARGGIAETQVLDLVHSLPRAAGDAGGVVSATV